MKNNRENKDLLTISEVSNKLGVHPETLRRWDKEGKLKAVRIGIRGHRKYPKSEIEHLINRTPLV